jgi:small subunit ribosomal protein S20
MRARRAQRETAVANSRSARKRIRSSERKHVRNRGVRAAVRTTVGKARRALLGTPEAAETEEQVRAAIRALDRAAEKGILHAKNARRRKSRLAVMAARLTTAAGGEAGEKAAARSAATGGAKGRGTRAAARKSPSKQPKASAGRTAARPAGRSSAATATRTARSARPPRGEPQADGSD